MELDTRAGGLRSDRVGVRGQPLDTGDGDFEVLAACREDLLVEQLVARIRTEAVRMQVLRPDGRQDPDDHHVRADGARALLAMVETRAGVSLQLVEHAST